MEVRNKGNSSTVQWEYQKDGILWIQPKKGAKIDVPQLKENLHELKGLPQNSTTLVIFDARIPFQITTEARELAAKGPDSCYKKAQAILIDELPNRLMANFFVNVQRPDFPVKVFQSEEKAREWLYAIRKKEDPSSSGK